jgi:hypothetical protein
VACSGITAGCPRPRDRHFSSRGQKITPPPGLSHLMSTCIDGLLYCYAWGNMALSNDVNWNFSLRHQIKFLGRWSCRYSLITVNKGPMMFPTPHDCRWCITCGVEYACDGLGVDGLGLVHALWSFYWKRSATGFMSESLFYSFSLSTNRR